MNDIVFEHVSKAYGRTQVLRDLNFRIHEGERLILLGASGCGKSTTLRMVAGLDDITEGNLYMNGERVNDLPGGKRNVSMVFQNYALYPHMTVAENIIYGLRVKKVAVNEVKQRLEEVLRMLHLEGLERRKPKELSGGQRQRVALARAVVKRSPVLLLDEPLSNLDAQLRMHARKELVRIHETYGQTFLYVTHDQTEAMTVGDRIAVMHGGIIEMLDTPYNVYHRPVNVFTAKFVGSPSMNIFPAVLSEHRVMLGDQEVELCQGWYAWLRLHGHQTFSLGVRPEELAITEQTEGTLAIQVKYTESYGKMHGIYFELDGVEGIAITDREGIQPGNVLHLSLKAAEVHFFDRDNGDNLGYPEGNANDLY